MQSPRVHVVTNSLHIFGTFMVNVLTVLGVRYGQDGEKVERDDQNGKNPKHMVSIRQGYLQFKIFRSFINVA